MHAFIYQLNHSIFFSKALFIYMNNEVMIKLEDDKLKTKIR